MVKGPSWIKLFLVLAMVMVSAVRMAPTYAPQSQVQDGDDPSKRNARSAEVPFSAGTSSIIRLIINNRYLQLYQDGTVNGTDEDFTDNSILMRSAVDAGLVKIEGLATCSFLCMNSCGHLYSTSDYNDECVFNETIESNNYNVYTSHKYSNKKHTTYVALNSSGKPRQVRRKAGAGTGKLAACANALTEPVSSDQVDKLEQRKRSLYADHQAHQLRHNHLCPPPYHETTRRKRSRHCRKKKRAPTGAVDVTHKDHQAGAKKKAPAQDEADCKEKKCKKKKSAQSSKRSKTAKSAQSESAEEDEATTAAAGAEEGADD